MGALPNKAGSQAHQFLRRTFNPRLYPREKRGLGRTYTNHCEWGQVRVMPMSPIYFEPLRTNANHSALMSKPSPSPPKAYSHVSAAVQINPKNVSSLRNSVLAGTKHIQRSR